MKKVTLTEEQQSLLALCVEIAREKFSENALVDQRLAAQFNKQVTQAGELLLLITLASEITILDENDFQED